MKYVVFVLMLYSFSSFSQEQSCGSRVTPEVIQAFEEKQELIRRLEDEFLSRSGIQKSYSLPTMIPIKAHVIRRSDGTGGLTETELFDALDVLNDLYQAAELEFFLCSGINYIDDSSLYDFRSEDELEMTNTHGVDNVINIYFANTVTLGSSSGIALCGYAYYPSTYSSRETILMNNSCTTSGNTLAHEIGHFYGLFHTHGLSNSTLTDELVDGSNCGGSGDRICDTPADPKLSSSNVSYSCAYFGTLVDANNDVFDPDPHNIMSYSLHTCRTQFSPQQYARINAFSRTLRSNLQCPSFYPDFTADITESCDSNLTINFTDVSVGATSWAWDVNGDSVIDYTTQNVSHSFTDFGQYDVTLYIANETDTIHVTKQEYINLGGPLLETPQVQLSITFDNYPSDISWELKDQNGFTVYEGGNYDDSYAHTTINEIFDVNQDSCYYFIINDSDGDGMCCSTGNGNYTLSPVSNGFGTIIASGGEFRFTDQRIFHTEAVLSQSEFDASAIRLFPNPTKEKINILVPNHITPETYAIYNPLGQEIRRKKVLLETDLEIDVKDLKQGIYFIKLTRENESLTMRFIRK